MVTYTVGSFTNMAPGVAPLWTRPPSPPGFSISTAPGEAPCGHGHPHCRTHCPQGSYCSPSVEEVTITVFSKNTACGAAICERGHPHCPTSPLAWLHRRPAWKYSPFSSLTSYGAATCGHSHSYCPASPPSWPLVHPHVGAIIFGTQFLCPYDSWRSPLWT